MIILTKCIIKREIKFQDYKECLENNKTIMRLQQRFRSEAHNIFTEKVNRIAPCVNDNREYKCLTR